MSIGPSVVASSKGLSVLKEEKPLLLWSGNDSCFVSNGDWGPVLAQVQQRISTLSRLHVEAKEAIKAVLSLLPRTSSSYIAGDVKEHAGALGVREEYLKTPDFAEIENLSLRIINQNSYKEPVDFAYGLPGFPDTSIRLGLIERKPCGRIPLSEKLHNTALSLVSLIKIVIDGRLDEGLAMIDDFEDTVNRLASEVGFKLEKHPSGQTSLRACLHDLKQRLKKFDNVFQQYKAQLASSFNQSSLGAN